MKRNPNVPTGFDPTTNCQVFIGMQHHETHDGEVFGFAQGPLVATTDYLFVVPTGTNCHLAFEATTDAAAAGSVELYPLVTASANGTAFSQVFNRKTAGGILPATVVTTGPTITAPVLDAASRTFMGLLYVAGAKAGTLDREVMEFVLTPGKHLLRLTRGASGNLGIIANWYEETL